MLIFLTWNFAQGVNIKLCIVENLIGKRLAGVQCANLSVDSFIAAGTSCVSGIASLFLAGVQVLAWIFTLQVFGAMISQTFQFCIFTKV